MPEDYAELKRRIAEMQAQKGTIQGAQSNDVQPGHSIQIATMCDNSAFPRLYNR